ncbi:uncharacterized protein LOC122544523 isoform X3 [Chiloscyllium plagiosum]|uniref:uncharacterized protein LOC122544523 isoform X3 n=1 Tax=Chiloscyllium plagiosum TaxID=36176 RepID=UPI001CB88842|nr:uncharacterized protein LOC122544523 isoform X3 [Chiloscyllium plagiosum]
MNVLSGDLIIELKVHFHVLIEMHEIYGIPKPVVSLNPSYEVFLEGETTLVKCSCQCPVTRTHCCYSHDLECSEINLPEGQCDTSLQLKFLTRGESTFKCECLFALANGTWRRSGFTDPIQINVSDQLSKPIIKVLQDSRDNSNRGNVVISCKGEIRRSGGTFYLYNNWGEGSRQYRLEVTSLEDTADFTINAFEHTSAGNYSCQYETVVNGAAIFSRSSQSVSVTEKRKMDRPSKGTKPELYLYIGLGCAAVIIILFVVPCLILIKKGRNKHRNVQRTSTSTVQNRHSKNHDGICGNANLIYYNPTGEYSDVNDKKCEGVTYAVLNMDRINKNESASVVREEPCVYMDVKT